MRLQNLEVPKDSFESRTGREWVHLGYIVRQQLALTRNWPPDLIDQFMSEACMELENPYNKNQIMRLYLLKRVYKIERSIEFKQALLQRTSSQLKNYVEYKKQLQEEKRQFKLKIKNHNNAIRRLRNREISNVETEKLSKLGLV